LKPKKTIFKSRYGMCLSIFLFLSKLDKCPQNLIPTRGEEHWEKNQFPLGCMLKFTYKGYFLTIKKTYKKLLYWKSKSWTYTLVLPLHTEIFILKNTKISLFGGISKFLKLIVVGQILADFGSLGQFWADLLHWHWLTAWHHAPTWAEIFKSS
jgi:hypothetical protein